MKLRNLPKINFPGCSNWPPTWVRTRTETQKTRCDEIGIMTGASLNEAAPNLLFLTASISGEHYMSCLVFTDREFCRRLNVFLQAHIGKCKRNWRPRFASHSLSSRRVECSLNSMEDSEEISLGFNIQTRIFSKFNGSRFQ
jgi:hypothetical protein